MSDPRRLILLVLAASLAVSLGVPSALGQSAWDKKHSLDMKISGLRDEIARAKQKEGVLSTEISTASSRIGGLEGDIGALTVRLTALESDLAVQRARLARLQARFREQTRNLVRLQRDHRIALERLEARLVQLYETSDASELDVLFQSGSLTDLIEQLDYFSVIGEQDKSISDRLQRLKIDMHDARLRTAATKKDVAKATAVLARKTEEQRAARSQLIAQQSALAAARSSKQSMLASLQTQREEDEEDLAAMQAASAAIAAQLQGSGGSSGSGVSASGLIWPVSGPITSGFGWRWGRMHEGIDISAGCGTPIRAAAAGTVVVAGWMGGYGNLVVIDHGNGLATAYAHQSAIYASGSVSQGQTIGAVGSTGNSTGCHLHFEVRVNGSPVDPLGYL
ncbi:MAG: peptidoglycan DD-metalloendopeptidase family protein [Gaiellaceae bacterium]